MKIIGQSKVSVDGHVILPDAVREVLGDVKVGDQLNYCIDGDRIEIKVEKH